MIKKLINYIRLCRLPKDDIRNPKHDPYEVLFKWLYRFGSTKIEVQDNHLVMGGMIHFPASDKMIKVIEEENERKKEITEDKV